LLQFLFAHDMSVPRVASRIALVWADCIESSIIPQTCKKGHKEVIPLI